jgi:hypothetical protein
MMTDQFGTLAISLRRTRLCAIAMLCTLYAAADASQVGVSTVVSTNVVTTPFRGFYDYREFDSMVINEPFLPGMLAALTAGVATSGAEGFAQANFGTLRTGATAFGGREADFTGRIHSESRSQAYFEDTVTIDAPGLTGTAGTVDIPIFIHANQIEASLLTLHRTDDPSSVIRAVALYDVTAQLSGANYSQSGFAAHTSELFGEFSGLGSGYRTQGIPVENLYIANHPVIFGQPFTLRLTLFNYAEFNNVVPAAAFGAAAIDFGSTVSWGGVAALRDAEGTLITDFTALGETGLDYKYAAVVPLPGAIGLFALALGVLTSARRRG